MSSTEDPSISNLMYIPYYMPDVNFNKVLYSNNIVKNGSILISDPGDGIIDLNQKYIDNFTNDYVYTPNVQSTVWNMNNTFVNNNLQYYFNGTKSNTQQSTKLGQTGIKNFNYNIIFGLTQADTSVIDWNYYGTGGITGNIALTDRIYSKLGPKLFLVNNGNYTDGTVTASGLANNTVSNASNISDINNANILSNMVGMTITPVDPSFNPITISNNTTLNNIYDVWPYKVQYNNNQYYNILTNGINEALLALPKVEVSTATQYLLTTKLNPSTLDPEYSYTDLGDIIQNNYHYIVSYFDTRPTVNNNSSLNFSSITSSLFNENLVQFMPLTNYNSNICSIMHTTGQSSYVASCIPVAWTTTQPHAFPNTLIDDLEGISPIRLEWGKNITIQAEINYTCANMKNLSEILTGWNYYGNNFTPASFADNKTSRINVPYINCGLVLYVPNLNSPSYNSVYEGNIKIEYNDTQGNSIQGAKIYCEILESDNIITQYYITINDQRVVLAVTPDPNHNFLPKIEEINNYAKYNTTSIDINGIFYNVNLYQTKQFPEILDLNIKNIQNIMNEYFTAVITMQKLITKSCVIDPANDDNVSFYIGNNLYTLQKSENSYPPTVTYGLYIYSLAVNSSASTITLTNQSLNDVNHSTSIQVPVITLSITNINEWYEYNSAFTSSSTNISLTTYTWNIYFSKFNNGYTLFFNNNKYNFNAGITNNTTIKLTDNKNGGSAYYTISVPEANADTSGNVNKFAMFKNWLKSFIPNDCQFWNEISVFKENTGGEFSLNNTDINNYVNNIYTTVVSHANGNLSSGQTSSSLQYLLSTPACISFDNVGTSPVLSQYDSKYIQPPDNPIDTHPKINTDNNFFGFMADSLQPDTSKDLIKLVNVLSIPITNALNTTHTATDTMTFRFEKPTSPSGLTDYYYIIGIYLYITKGLQLNTAQENPHYIGFSPSTNVLNPAILQGSGDTTGNGIPKSLDSVIVKNTTNLYNDNYESSILMKDYLLTPSIFMSINESTGNNL